MPTDINVPDLGDFKDVEVIDVLVKPGDQIDVDTPLLTIETEKATMDVPSTAAGVVQSVALKKGDRVSKGSLIGQIEAKGAAPQSAAPSPQPAANKKGGAPEEPVSTPSLSKEQSERNAGTPGGKSSAPAAAAPSGNAAGGGDIRVPDLGDFKDVEVIDVLVKPGDRIQVDTPLLTIETEKATMDVPSTAAGLIKSVSLKKGDRVSKGSLIGLLEGGAATTSTAPEKQADTAPPKAAAPAPAAAPAAAPASVKSAAPAQAPSAPKSPTGLPPIDEAGFARAYASPSVRKFAREIGADLGRIKGTGPKGRITPEDVKAFVKQALTSGAPAAAASGGGGAGLPKIPEVDFSKFGEIELKPLSRIQKISGARLQASWLNIPHVWQMDEADITDLEEARNKLKGKAAKEGIKLTPLAFVLRACVKALQEFPNANSSLDASGQNLVLKKYIHLGFAADTPNGLVVPVIRDADKKDVYEIARELGVLSEKARAGKLTIAEMQGATFTVSSLGGIGGVGFTPIINAPEVAILGVAKSSMKPVYKDGQFVPRLILPFTLAYDHRVIDGAAGVRFTTFLAEKLADVRALVEAVPVTKVTVPDIGDFKDVEVIDVLVKPGDEIAVETPLITLETEKATLDVPSSAAGVVKSVALKKGDKVSKGSLVVEVEAVAAAAAPAAAASAPPKETKSSKQASAAEDVPFTDTIVREKPAVVAASKPAPAKAPAEGPFDFDVVVLGAGPGGYTAAFRAADLGMKVALIERWPQLGGVCLNVGCIPSKALLHAAKVIEEAEAMEIAGLSFGKPTIDVAKLRGWKEKVVGKLTGGLGALAKQRKVEVIRGIGKFVSANAIAIANTDVTPTQSLPLTKGENAPGEGVRRISFKHCIIAAGSESIRLPGLPDDPRIIDSTGALELDLPKRMLVIGGGIIGLEMACVYDALGTKVSVVELTDGLIPGCDRDLVRPLEKRIAKRYEKIMVKTKVTKVEAVAEGIRVTFEGEQATEPQVYDKVLVAVGRSPNGKKIGAEAAGVVVGDRGFIPVDKQMRTNVPHIFAIGDIAGQPMLAHKASYEGKLAAEVAHGEKRAFDARVIPSVAYTDPEIAWVGLTETEAKAKGIAYEKGSFPWSANARSLTLGRDDGLTKVLFDPATHRVIGGGIVGPNAGDLISELALAIEMNTDAGDLGMTIHPHPTLSETVMFSAEAFEGTLTDLYVPKKKSAKPA